MNCPNCGTPNEGAARFCVSCGGALEAAAPGMTEGTMWLIGISAVILCVLSVLVDLLPDEPTTVQEFLPVTGLVLLFMFLVLPFWVRALWNGVVPSLCGGGDSDCPHCQKRLRAPTRKIGYWQALGIIVLVGLLAGLVAG